MIKYVPDGYWHSRSNGIFPSHEAICVINPYNEEITLKLTLYFEDRDKMDGFEIKVSAERTLHIRMDRIVNNKNEHVPQDVPYAIKIECEKEVPIQYSRMDTSQSEMSIMTTMI